eukprot:1359506-Amphidinium_carterae.1
MSTLNESQCFEVVPEKKLKKDALVAYDKFAVDKIITQVCYMCFLDDKGRTQHPFGVLRVSTARLRRWGQDRRTNPGKRLECE